ncbi:MAG: TonB-dependent receptor [Thiohalocapsa sp.]|jgi:hypothetical protein
MNQSLVRGALLGALLTPAAAVTAGDADIDALRAELDAMRSQYEGRIRALESRLSDAEQAAEVARQAAGADALSLPMTAPRVLRSQGQATGQVPAGSRSAGLFDAVTSGTAFNPQISVILDGNYYQDDTEDGNGAALVGEAFQAGGGYGHDHDHGADGHAHADGGHAHAVAEPGFNLRSAELYFSATVDPYFDAASYITVSGDGDVTLEEAYFQTRSLPYGLRVKGGKFLSDFGYINNQHPHQWDFVDQNLPYLNLLGFHGIQDTGVQLTWLPELPVYTLLGAEALQGDQEVFGATLGETEQTELNLGDTDSGPRLFTAFAKVAPELGRNHALQIGVSYAHATQHQAMETHTHMVETHADEHAHEEDHAHEDEHAHEEEHAHEDGHADEHMHVHTDGITEELHETGLAGDADLWGIDLVYKYDAPGAYGQGDFTFQSEYLRSSKDLTIRSSAHPERIGSNRTYTTDGLYAQATYGFLPKWKAGLRYDILGLTNKVSGGRSESFGSSDRWTANVTWNLSEFSQLRAQYAYNDILVGEDEHGEEREQFSAFYLQFLMSLGSHGAHEF